MKKSNVLKFIEQLKKDCKSNQIGLFLYDQKFIIEDGDKFGGWFDPTKRELHCSFPAKLQKKYVELLIHESCHMDQFLTKAPKWTIEQNQCSLELFWEWTKGKDCTHINTHLKNIQLMEAECEQLAVKKITGILSLALSSFSFNASSNPSMPGIQTSTIAKANSTSFVFSRASNPEDALIRFTSNFFMIDSRRRRLTLISSTISRFGLAFILYLFTIFH